MNDKELDELLGRLDPVVLTRLTELYSTSEARVLQENIFATTSKVAVPDRETKASFGSRIGNWFMPGLDRRSNDSSGLSWAAGSLGSTGRLWMAIGTACLLVLATVSVVTLMESGESENVVAVEPEQSIAAEEMIENIPVSEPNGEPPPTQLDENVASPPESMEAVESTPESRSAVSSGSFDVSTDLLSLHFANAESVDDVYASAAARSVTRASGISPFVVGGTYGDAFAGKYRPDSEPAMDAMWGPDGWLNANADRADAARQTADRWRETLINGGRVWVAEGGHSDFTAKVVRLLSKNPDVEVLLENVYVFQHSTFNEDGSNTKDFALVKAKTTYVRINDGNKKNGTADLAEPNPRFKEQALASQDSTAWEAAFAYADQGASVDFSDTVLVLDILDVPLAVVANTTDFAREYLQ